MANQFPNDEDWGGLSDAEVFRRLQEFDPGDVPLIPLPGEEQKRAASPQPAAADDPGQELFTPRQPSDDPNQSARESHDVKYLMMTAEESSRQGGDSELEVLKEIRTLLQTGVGILERWSSGAR